MNITRRMKRAGSEVHETEIQSLSNLRSLVHVRLQEPQVLSKIYQFDKSRASRNCPNVV